MTGFLSHIRTDLHDKLRNAVIEAEQVLKEAESAYGLQTPEYESARIKLNLAQTSLEASFPKQRAEPQKASGYSINLHV